MELSVAFIGTGGSVPTARRSTASVLVSRGGERIMFDCGEGTQRQLQRSLGLISLDSVFLTHLHADHFLGLPGLLKTYDLNDRSLPLAVYGPPGLIDLFAALERVVGRTRYAVDLVELEPGDFVGGDGYEIRPFEVAHRTRAFGYALAEGDRPGEFNPTEALRRGVPEGPEWGRLQRGEAVEGKDGPVRPEDVVGPSRRGRRIALTGDTIPCDSTREAARGAQLLIHDATFSDEEVERAAETGHSTARQAATLAAEAEVEMLALVHISSRYHVGALLGEARERFEAAFAPRDFDVVEIPFPERGGPELVRDGAREPRERDPGSEDGEQVADSAT